MSGDVLLYALGWAIVHSLWQCFLVWAALRLVLAIVPRAAAPTRYWLSCGALLLMLGGLGGTAWVAASRASLPGGAAAGEPARPAALDVASAPAGDAPGAAAPLVPIAPTGVAVLGARAAWGQAVRGIERALPALVALWGAGVLLFSLRLGAAWLQVRRMVRVGVAPPPEWLLAAAERLRRRLRISRPVRLLTSVAVGVPTVAGWLRPVVLLPLSALTGLTPRQIELLILHELVHVRRHDTLVNLLQAAAEIALFHHPAAWWVSRRIRQEREFCCDDAVARLEGVRDYVEALAGMEQVRSARPVLALAADGSGLLARVLRLVEARAAAPRRAPRLPALGVLLLLGAVALLPARRAGAAGAQVPAPRHAAPAPTRGCTPAEPGSTLCAELAALAGRALSGRADGGVVIVQDVATGAVLANSAAGTEAGRGTAPGSVWKLVLAGIWWDQGLGDAPVRCSARLSAGGRTIRNGSPITETRGSGVHGMLVQSCNTAAARMALGLRDRLGAEGLRRELARAGFPTAEAADTAAAGRDESFWATTSGGFREPMSPERVGVRLDAPEDWAGVALGAEQVNVTPLHLSRFVQAIGNGGLMLAPTVERAAALAPAAPQRVLTARTAALLREAMLDVVRRGTARGADRALAGTGWTLGGKTGTAPRAGGAGDGWFAGLAFDRTGAARYSFVVYLPRSGRGGGESARLAAELAAELSRSR
ncbi:M56 family metallopeptidase [Longimicrobium sp.]|uniref:M56 family metallopeptidase n=1 Tax=Longimicrobium sp. TaxID=2029185 RepID=UPI002CFC94DB|nr:M56 family metallopeptidase [Longimicrobium sp.]HSU15800.1 M56 family metallopeptidase [Longimicrobium sp.]